MWAVYGEVDRPVTDILVFVAQESCRLILDLFTHGFEVCELPVRQMSGELCILLSRFRAPQVQQEGPPGADAGASWKKVPTNLDKGVSE